MAGKTNSNLAKAFAGESQAYQRYINFAVKAEAEGEFQVAKMFRAAAEGEKIHAALHFKSLDAVKSTKENLQVAINGETEEYTHMYPEMIDDARNENEKTSEIRFNWANQVEERHANEFKRLLDNLGAVEEVDYFVCPICGFFELGATPEKCPVCGAPGETFKKY